MGNLILKNKLILFIINDFHFNKIYGGQLPRYSNIEERIVDYNKAF